MYLLEIEQSFLKKKERLVLLYVSAKLPTYLSPKPTLTLSSHLGQNVGLGERYVGSFPEMYNNPNLSFFFKHDCSIANRYIWNIIQHLTILNIL